MRRSPFVRRPFGAAVLVVAVVVAFASVSCGDDDVSMAGDGGDATGGGGGPPGGNPGRPPDGPGPGSTDPGDDDGGFDTGLDTWCGDGFIDVGEQCDTEELGEASCEIVGFDPGATGLRCTDGCVFDFSMCQQPDPRWSCGDGIVEGPEECDGEVFGITCEELGWPLGEVRCSDRCELDFTECASACGDGLVTRGEDCDGAPLGPGGEPLSCEDVLGFGAEGEVGCFDCELDLSSCSQCGNGLLEPGEACDEGDFGGASCASLGLGVGPLGCSFQCELQTGACSLCGNGVIDETEACDGDELAGRDCASFGFAGGTLGCSAGCEYDVSGCGICGDGLAQGGEACDGADLGGATCADIPGGLAGEVSCTADCELDGSACLMAFPGALVITEILYAPLQSPLAVAGQWFELHNYDLATPYAVQGCSVHSNNANETFEIEGPLSVPPGGYVVLATPDGDEDLGFVPDYAIPPGFVLLNGGDEITLECGGVTIDTVVYDNEAPWPGQPAGVSVQLHPALLGAPANDDGANWCAATTEYGIGQLGTPGGPNACPP